MSWQQRAVDRSPAVRKSRQRSIEQARLVIDAAQRLMTESGTADLTVQRLASEAGIALQTFYRYFTDKDELLLAVLEDMIAKGTERIAAVAAAEPDPLNRLRSIVVQVAGGRVMDRPPTAMTPRFVTQLHLRLQQEYPREIEDAIRPYVKLLVEAIDDATAAGYIEPLNRERDAWAIANLVLATYHNASMGAMDDDQTEAGEHIWQFCLTALRPVTPVPAGGKKSLRPRPASRRAS